MLLRWSSFWVRRPNSLPNLMPLPRMSLPFRRSGKYVGHNLRRKFQVDQRNAKHLWKTWSWKTSHSIFLRQLWHAYLCKKPTSSRNVGLKNRELGWSFLVQTGVGNLLFRSASLPYDSRGRAKIWENTLTALTPENKILNILIIGLNHKAWSVMDRAEKFE